MASWYGKLCDFATSDVRLIHEASLEILEKLGVYLDHELVLEKCKAFGGAVDFDRKIVKFPGELVEQKLLTFKNACDRGLPPETMRFAAGGEADYILDLETGEQRRATIEDLAAAVKIADKLPYIDEVDTLVYLPDIPSPVSDLFTWKTVWTHTCKTGGGALGMNGNAIQNYSDRGLEYLMRLTAIKAGGMDKVREKPLFGGAVCFSSPLRLSNDVLRQMVKLIELGQYVGICSNVFGGAQAPATFAGIAAVENAERLGGLLAALSLDEDAHVYFSNNPQYLDMSAGSVSQGSTELARAALVGRAVFKHYGFNHMFGTHPSAAVGSHRPDAQAGMEKMMTMLLAGLAGHKGVCALGMLNECYSHVQLVIDNEIAGMVRTLMKGVEINEEEIDLDLILKAGVGGNYLEHPERILEQVKRSYHRPSVLNRDRWHVWTRDGSRSITDRAREKARELLAQEHTRYLTDNQLAEMDALIEEAERELL